MPRNARRYAAAAAFSLAVHGALLLALLDVRLSRPRPPAAVEEPPGAVVLLLPRPPPPTVRPEAPARPAPRPVRPQRPPPPPPPTTPVPRPRPPLPRPPSGEDVAASQEALAGRDAPAREAPPQEALQEEARRREAQAREEAAEAAEAARLAAIPRGNLFPTVPGLGGGLSAGASPGSTRRAWEGDGTPTQEEEARLGAAAKGVADAALADAAARYRVDTGLVDTYFTEMAKALRAGTEAVPADAFGSSFVENLLGAWQPGAKAWAEGKNPYGEGQVPEPRRPEGHEGSLAAAAAKNAGDPLNDMLRHQESTAKLREFADGRFGQGIVALVEFRHSQEGRFKGSVLVRSSGNRRFDEHVLTTGPAALEKLGPPTAPLHRVSPEGFRSLWSFEGRILFTHKRKLKDVDARTLLGAAATAALDGLVQGLGRKAKGPGEEVGAMTGTFDLGSDEVEIVDLTQPRFSCRVKLLGVY